MEAVIGDGDFEQTVALVVGKAEKVHRGIVHAHHELQFVGLLRMEEVVVGWGRGAEDTLAQVEVVARLVVVEVGVEAEETAQPHEEHEVEVGEAVCLAVEPLDAAGDIVEEGLVALFGASVMASLWGWKGMVVKGEARRTSDIFCSCALGRMSVSTSRSVRGWKSCFLMRAFDVLGMLTMNDSRPCVLVNRSTIILVSPYLREWRTMAWVFVCIRLQRYE